MSNMLGRPYASNIACKYGCCYRYSRWHSSRKTSLSRLRSAEKRFWRKDQGCS